MSHYDTGTGHTDHAEEIATMRAWAEMLTKGDPFSKVTTASGEMPTGTLVTILEAAAGLLEVHDHTGISLDDWHGPKELVQHALVLMQFSPDALLPNGV